MTLPLWPAVAPDVFERDLLARWKTEDLFRASLVARAQGEPFVFFEGPPTANGRPGIHHVFSRTIKDLICRFRTMQGRRVTRIAGWDTHGLPVEIEVEKQLALTGKRDIERYGIAEFNRLCRESVFQYQREWVELSDRIAYWLDYDHPYVTCSNAYVETVWWLLRRLHDRDLLYRGHRVLPYCPRCGTTLSSHELALGYEETRDRAVYVTFPLTGPEGWELVVWTTTPWTLPANVAVAVHPDLSYGVYRVPHDGTERLLVMAVERAGALTLGGHPVGATDPVATFPGRALTGRTYRRPLDVVPFPAEGRREVVVPGEFVTATDGSGLVHLAPAFGADDYAAGRTHDLAMLRPVAADGTFTGTTWPALEGTLVTAAETNTLLIQRLKEEGRHLLTEQVVHTYPHCWRCRQKLIYYARDSWFVRTSAVRDRMLAVNRRVGWHPPEVGARRFGDWLENNVDWALSRDRYWGTPLPVWVCDAHPEHIEVLGAYADLAARTGPLPGGFDPHRPHIDGYSWRCACGGTMRRTPEVIDTWFDSGAMPYAQWHYPFEGEAEFATHFPADFICEGVDQTRGWFYSLLAIGVAAFDREVYRHVIVNELVLDAAGQKMSKSRGNVVDPWAVIAEWGADAVRLSLIASSQVWLPKKFDPRGIQENAGGFLNTLRNTYNFFAVYAGEVDAPPTGDAAPALIDRWLAAALDACVRDVTAAWEAYDVTTGVKRVMSFVVDDLSNWYVRLNRPRFWAPDARADPAAVAALRHALVTVARLLAPVCPFTSDWLHRALTGTPVHLAPFPVAGPAGEETLVEAMASIRVLASLARAARETGGHRVRQPLARMQVVVPPRMRTAAWTSLLPLLEAEVNVKAIELVQDDTAFVSLTARPNFRTLGKRYGKGTPQVAAAVQQLPAAALRTLEQGGRVDVEANGARCDVGPEDVTVERSAATDWLVQAVGDHAVALDPVITPALRREGIARELLSRVQRLRKDADLPYDARIALAIAGDPPILEAAAAHQDLIRREALVRTFAVGTSLAAAEQDESFELDGFVVHLMVARLAGGPAFVSSTPDAT